MASLLNKLAQSRISRRDFLKGSVMATAAVAGLSLSGCDSNRVVETTTEYQETEPVTQGVAITHTEPVNPEEGGMWVSAACWHNCGGKCVNKVMVKDGVVIRQKTDDFGEDTFEYPQQRGCLRGRSQQQQCFGADRLRVPMKRKHWEPLTGGQKELRGVDEWEAITWEEAIKYIADEIKNVVAKYGNSAILVPGTRTTGAAQAPAIKAYGGHTAELCSCSCGTYYGNVQLLGLPNQNSCGGLGTTNDRFDLPNAELIVMTGSNPVWSAMGGQINNFIRAKEKGTEFIVIGPNYNATAQVLDATWIPVRPGTDTAFLLATAYEMLRLDAEGGDLIDWDFLYSHSVGFDAQHLPADATVQEGFAEYVKGEYDGIPKTPEWASKICGTPAEQITWYAGQIGKNRAVMLLNTYAPARNRGAENYPQISMTIGMMGGHLGKPGHATGLSYHQWAGNDGMMLAFPVYSFAPNVTNPVTDVITSIELWPAVLNGKYHYAGSNWSAYEPTQERTCDIHMIYYDSYGYLQSGVNITEGIQANRKVDFVCAKAMTMTTQARYADIILPVTTTWERPGGIAVSNRETVIAYQKVVEPLYQAKSDQEIEMLLLEALGIEPRTVYYLSEEAQAFYQITTAMYLDPTFSMKYICTLTQEDIDNSGVAEELAAVGMALEPHEGAMSLQEFLDRGCFHVQRAEGDSYGMLYGNQWMKFLMDPENNPTTSKSGKFEIYCQAKADLFNNMFHGPEVKPYPNYLVPTEGYETTFKEGDMDGEKGEYPFLVYNPHYFRRSHSTLDNLPWLREACPNPVFIATADAKEKGIVDGDTVLIYNKWGKILRQASVVETMMPGIVGIPHGSWVDMDEETGIDRGGADNVLCGPITSNMGVAGYNNHNCNIEKYDGEPLVPDCEKPQRIFEFE